MSPPPTRPRLTRPTAVVCAGLLLAGVLAPSAVPAQGGASAPTMAGPLDGEAVRRLVSGNTLKGAWRARPYEFDYKPDGTVYGTIWTNPDRGTWHIDDDKFCQEWFEFFGGDKRCYEWYRAGDEFLLKNVDAFRTRDIRGRIIQGLK